MKKNIRIYAMLLVNILLLPLYGMEDKQNLTFIFQDKEITISLPTFDSSLDDNHDVPRNPLLQKLIPKDSKIEIVASDPKTGRLNSKNADAESYEYAHVWFDLLKTMYTSGGNSTWSFNGTLEAIRNHRETFKKILQDEETDQPDDVSQEEIPSTVWQVLQQRFPTKTLETRPTKSTQELLKSLLIGVTDTAIIINQNEDTNESAKDRRLERQASRKRNNTLSNSFFNTFLCGSLTTLGIIGILHIPKLYRWYYS